MKREYGALRFVGTVYKVVGGIVAVLALLAVLGVCLLSVLDSAVPGGIARELGRDTGFGAFLGIPYGGGLALTLYAIGEGIYLGRYPSCDGCIGGTRLG